MWSFNGSKLGTENGTSTSAQYVSLLLWNNFVAWNISSNFSDCKTSTKNDTSFVDLFDIFSSFGKKFTNDSSIFNLSENNPDEENATSSVEPFVSLSLRNTFMAINGSVLFLLAVSGIPINILNMVAFRKLGLSVSINISFFALSAVDFACACLYLFVAVIMQDMYGFIDIGVDISDVQYLSAFVLISFTTCGSFVTALINLERCCCVVLPVRVKDIFTRLSTVGLIAGMLLIQAAITAVHLASLSMTITTKSSMHSRPKIVLNRTRIDSDLHFALLWWGASFPTLISFAIVVICSIFLAFSFKQREKWLNSLAAPHNATIAKNKKLINIVVVISFIYIICYLPRVILNVAFIVTSSTTSPFETKSENLTLILSSFIRNFQALSGMCNTFAYLKMNTRFKQYLKNLLCLPCAQIRARCLSD
ncbi:chemosensory receptor B [Elysia marginata]|uniref:Chemosensory receptor B n=1 Tax=Elysia marginata TaxID=1093978 RepID=A0AAV4J4U0_9GAST|nr:chemosensory receptor B [Elysia marginata]